MIALVAGAVVAGGAFFTMNQPSSEEEEKKAPPKQLTDTKDVMQKFSKEHPNQENAG